MNTRSEELRLKRHKLECISYFLNANTLTINNDGKIKEYGPKGECPCLYAYEHDGIVGVLTGSSIFSRPENLIIPFALLGSENAVLLPQERRKRIWKMQDMPKTKSHTFPDTPPRHAQHSIPFRDTDASRFLDSPDLLPDYYAPYLSMESASFVKNLRALDLGDSPQAASEPRSGHYSDFRAGNDFVFPNSDRKSPNGNFAYPEWYATELKDNVWGAFVTYEEWWSGNSYDVETLYDLVAWLIEQSHSNTGHFDARNIKKHVDEQVELERLAKNMRQALFLYGDDDHDEPQAGTGGWSVRKHNTSTSMLCAVNDLSPVEISGLELTILDMIDYIDEKAPMMYVRADTYTEMLEDSDLDVSGEDIVWTDGVSVFVIYATNTSVFSLHRTNIFLRDLISDL